MLEKQPKTLSSTSQPATAEKLELPTLADLELLEAKPLFDDLERVIRQNLRALLETYPESSGSSKAHLRIYILSYWSLLADLHEISQTTA